MIAASIAAAAGVCVSSLPRPRPLLSASCDTQRLRACQHVRGDGFARVVSAHNIESFASNFARCAKPIRSSFSVSWSLRVQDTLQFSSYPPVDRSPMVTSRSNCSVLFGSGASQRNPSVNDQSASKSNLAVSSLIATTSHHSAEAAGYWARSDGAIDALIVRMESFSLGSISHTRSSFRGSPKSREIASEISGSAPGRRLVLIASGLCGLMARAHNSLPD
jgi:hypothetical protein